MDWQITHTEEDEKGITNYVEMDNGWEFLVANGRYDQNEWYGKLEFNDLCRGISAEFEVNFCSSFADVKAKLIQVARDKIAELNKVLESLEKFNLED